MKSVLWNEGHEAIFFTPSVQASSTNRVHVTKSHFLFLTGFFIRKSIYFNYATYSFNK